jgi:hypothetical protein
VTRISLSNGSSPETNCLRTSGANHSYSFRVLFTSGIVDRRGPMFQVHVQNGRASKESGPRTICVLD